MPVVLRTPNDPATESAFLPVLGKVLRGYPTPNTNLAAQSASQTGDESILFNAAGLLALPSATFPAVLILTVNHARRRAARSAYSGHSTYMVRYYDEWATNGRSFDQVWSDIGTDLERMIANAEDNDTMTLAGLNLTVALEPYTISGYTGHEIDKTTIPGRTLIVRYATLPYVVLPYDVAF